MVKRDLALWKDLRDVEIGYQTAIDHDLFAISVSLSNLSRDSTNEKADFKFTETYTWLKQTQERLDEFKKCAKKLWSVRELVWDIVTALERSESADENNQKPSANTVALMQKFAKICNDSDIHEGIVNVQIRKYKDDWERERYPNGERK